MKRRARFIETTPSSQLKHLKHSQKVEYGIPKKVKKESKSNVIKDYLIDYTNNSNLHGLRYIGAKETTTVEKVFWMIVFTCCAVYCSKLILDAYVKWNESPDIVSFAENAIPNWKIPFPAVTVCSQTKAQQLKYNFTENYHIYNINMGNYTGHSTDLTDEEVFWMIVFTCCAVYCSKLILDAYVKWNESPDIVSFAENAIPNWKIPFPAVTVCSQTKAQQLKYNFTENYHIYNINMGNYTGHSTDLTDEEKSTFEYISMVCDSHLSPLNGKKYGSGLEAVIKLKEVCPNIAESFFSCKWDNIPRDYCSDLFWPILTEEGICYTFNTLGASEMLRLEKFIETTPSSQLKHLKHSQKVEYGIPKQVKKESKSNVIKDYLIDYTNNSNLHGLRYIGAKETTTVEKVFWMIVFTCCAVYCSKLILDAYVKWNESPDIVSFAENAIPNWKIPFPAVTVCSQTKAQQLKYNFTENYHIYNINMGNYTGHSTDLTDEEKSTFEYISMVCDSHLSPLNGKKYGSGLEAVIKLKEVCPNIAEFFFVCKWDNIPRDYCSDLFWPILTEEGICYTFNTLGASEMLRLENLHTDYDYLQEGNPNYTTTWSLENGYPEDTPIVTYPHRGTGYGAKAGLTFILKALDLDLDYLCRGPVQGYKILLHNPAELPRLSVQYFRAPLSQEVVVSVKPKIMTTSDNLLPYSPNIRKCYFSSERYLRYFRVYTQASCEMECLSNFTYSRCGCVHFGMLYGENMTVCSAGSIQCIENAQKELVTVAAMSSLERHSAQHSNSTMDENSYTIAMSCMCMPACMSIEYEAETSQADYDWRALFTSFKLPISADQDDTYLTRISIFFKEAQSITSRRSELYNPTDFLASFGGLLGLFMGFSILSVVEIIYFFSLRIICLFWKRRAHKRVADKSKIKLEHPYMD